MNIYELRKDLMMCCDDEEMINEVLKKHKVIGQDECIRIISGNSYGISIVEDYFKKIPIYSYEIANERYLYWIRNLIFERKDLSDLYNTFEDNMKKISELYAEYLDKDSDVDRKEFFERLTMTI